MCKKIFALVLVICVSTVSLVFASPNIAAKQKVLLEESKRLIEQRQQNLKNVDAINARLLILKGSLDILNELQQEEVEEVEEVKEVSEEVK